MFHIFKRSFYSALFILVIFIIVFVFMKDFTSPKPISWGVTFSSLYAKELGLDWKQTYLDILDDLKIRKLRLAVYWSSVEKIQGEYEWQEVDWQLAEAQKRGAEVILAIGPRVPRWPECHIPLWARDLSDEEYNMQVNILYQQTIEHFKVYSNITTWQVSNEPFLKSFGICRTQSPEQINAYIKIVKSLDTKSRPVMLTESGELSTWVKSAKLADIIGSSLYRTVWNQYFGYWRYPWPPAFYRWHADLVQKLFPVQKIIISELQAEPWPPGNHILATSLDDQFKSFNLNRLQKNISYVKKTGFDEVYLWGVEWWYYLKLNYNHPEFWKEIKNLK
jgi:hypothetical protein